MKRADLIGHVAAMTGLKRVTAKNAIDAVFAAIVAAAKEGEEVSLPGFGKFKVKQAPERQGRNLATGETIRIAASRKLAFAPTKQLKDALAESGPHGVDDPMAPIERLLPKSLS